MPRPRGGRRRAGRCRHRAHLRRAGRSQGRPGRSPREARLTTVVAPALRIHLTGRLSVDAGDAALGVESFRGRQGRIAFAYLALHHDRAVPRAELADVIWRGELPGSWESDLSAIVSRLRGALTKLGLDGSRTIPSALGCYELRAPDGPVWVDIEEARHALDVAALALEAGDAAAAVGSATVAREISRRPFLPGDDAPWLDGVREELSGMQTRALATLADAWTSTGDVRQAVDATEEELRIDPFRESAYRRLMTLHASAGDRPQALRVWQRCRTLLSEELGIDPSPETHAVYLDLLRPDPSAAEQPVRVVTVPAQRGIVTFLFTDLVASTELLALGEDVAESIRSAHFRMLRDAVATRGGEEVKSLGDGLMVAFASVRDAISCAIAMQQAVQRYNHRADNRIGVRIGLHVGEPIRAEEDYFGTAVVIARRLCDDASGGQILASDLVRGLAGPQTFSFVDAGARALKGLKDVVDAYEVGWTPTPEERIDLPAILRPPADPPFVGRERELGWLDERATEIEAGRLRVAIVPGDPGIGKTRLVSEFSARAHERGATVLYGRCEEEALVAYQPFVEAIERYADVASLEHLRRHAGRGAPDLARLVPAISRRMPTLPAPLSGEADSERFRLFDAVASFFSSLADDGSVLLVVEDVHWADQPTLLLLRHLSRHARAASLLVVATVRDVEVTRRHPLVEVVDDLKRDDSLATLPLAGLDANAVREIVQALTGRSESELVRAVVRATEGNPLFVRELARHIAETSDTSVVTVPEGIRGLIGRRIDRLGDETLHTLSRAAVVGRDFDLDVLTKISDASEEATLEMLDAAVEARVVEEVSGAIDRYTFTHALIRETLYDRLGAGRRRRLHVRTAQALEALRADRLGPSLGELAYHYSVSGAEHAASAYRYAIDAADHAMDQLAYEDAAINIERAHAALEVSVPDDPTGRMELLIRLGDTRQRSGDAESARAAFRAASELAHQTGDVVAQARAALGMAGVWLFTGLVDRERITMLERALDALGDRDAVLRARLLAKLAEAVYHDPASVELREQLSRQALDIARRSADPATLAECLRVRNFAMWSIHPIEDQIENADEIIRIGRETGDQELELHGVVWRMHAWQENGSFDRLETEHARYTALAEELRQPRYMWYAMTRAASMAIAKGRYAEGERLAYQAYAFGQQANETDVLHVFSGQMTMLWAERHDMDGFAIMLEQREEHEDYFGDNDLNTTLMWWRWRVLAFHADLGAIDEAQDHLDRLRRIGFDRVPRDFHWYDNMSAISETCATLADHASAKPLYDLLRLHLGKLTFVGGVVMSGATDHHLGRLAAVLADRSGAETHLNDALTIYERNGLRPWIAHAHFDLAKLFAHDDRARALECAQAAGAVASDVGMPVLEGRVQELISALA